MTANRFKERYGNHKKSFNDRRYKYEIELSKYVWKLKESGKDYDIKWSIVKRAPSYTAGGKKCHLCQEEKLCLLKANKNRTLNRRCELFAKCRHAEKFLAGKFTRAQPAKVTRARKKNPLTSSVSIQRTESMKRTVA